MLRYFLNHFFFILSRETIKFLTFVSYVISQIVFFFFLELRNRDKRTVSLSSSSSSSSTSTELCDEPASDSERSEVGSDCDINCGGDGDADVDAVLVANRVGDENLKTETADDNNGDDDDSEVSLAEVLRANSEVLNRICKGDGAERDRNGGEGEGDEQRFGETADVEERLPDLVNDIVVMDGICDDRSEPAGQRPTEGNEELASGLGESGNDDDDATPVKPFAPFPSKVRQPKQLGIKLGLYPGGSN